MARVCSPYSVASSDDAHQLPVPDAPLLGCEPSSWLCACTMRDEMTVSSETCRHAGRPSVGVKSRSRRRTVALVATRGSRRAGCARAACRRVVRAVLDGRVVALLGAGANLCGRPPNTAWERDRYLPSGAELASNLAAQFDYPGSDLDELGRISEYAYVMTGSGPLYDQLHRIFDADYAIGPLHRFLASLPARLREAGRPHGCAADPDDQLRRRARARVPGGRRAVRRGRATSPTASSRGKFVHSAPGRRADRGRRAPNEYRALRPEERTVILKIHGAVDRADATRRWTATSSPRTTTSTT